MKHSLIKKIISVFSAVSVISGMLFGTFSVNAAATDDWYDASDLRAVQVNSNDVTLLTYVRNSFERLKISFPVSGGFRFYAQNYEGYFSPDSIQKIKSEAAQSGTRFYGADNRDISIVINRNTTPWRMEIYNSDGLVYEITGSQIRFKKSGNAFKETELRGSIKNDELMYGMGELFDGLYLNGTVHTLWNSDCWSDEESTYKSIPILHSTEGYMLYFNSSYKAVADIGAAAADKYNLHFYGPVFDMYFWAGTPTENISAYSALTGTPALQPKWAFRYWGGAASSLWESGGKDNACNILKEKLAGYKALGINNLAAMYGENTLDNIPAAYSLLNANNIKMLGWCNPFLTLDDYSEIAPELSRDITSYSLPRLKNASGTDYHTSDVIDFTHKNAAKIISEVWRDKIADGLRGLMVDYCEYVPTDSIAANGMSGEELHNFYPYFYTKQLYELFNKSCGEDFILFARSASPGSQKWAANFGGDQQGNFSGLRKAVNALLTFSSCGFSTWGTDIGGLATGKDPELYMRWMQFGAVNPLMRLHGTGDGDPWYYGKTAEESFKSYYWLRENLLKKIYSSSVYANKSGIPMCQSMPVAFPGQKALFSAAEQYLFCEDILVCPVTEKGAYYADVYFPNGNWVDLWTGEVISGGKRAEVDAPLNRSPLYIRSGSAFPVSVSSETLTLATSFSDETAAEALLVTAPNGTRSSDFYTDKNTKTTYTVSAVSDNSFEIYSTDVSGGSRVIMLYGVNASGVSVDGAALTESDTLSLSAAKPSYYIDGSLRTVVILKNGEWSKITVTADGAKNRDLAASAAISSNSVSNVSLATDGFADTSARIYAGTQSFITLDFGKEEKLGDLFLKWAGSGPESYSIKISSDGTSWKPAASVTNGGGMIEHMNLSGVSARYIRFESFTSSQENAFYLYELNIYSDTASDNIPNLSRVSDYNDAYTEKMESVTVCGSDIRNSVSVYGGTNASSSGLSKADFDDRFETAEGGVIHKITELGSCGDVWSAQNEVVSSALYKAKKMRDFELKVRMINVDKNWAVLPRVIFGVQDPTAWINTSGGGYTVGLYNEGNSYFNGLFNGAYASNADPVKYNEQGKFYSLWDAWYNLTVRVQGEKVTVTVEDDEHEPYSYQYDLGALGAEYKGGYIGFAFGTGVSKIYSMTVTDLGGKVLNDISYNFTSADNADEIFDVYCGTDAKNSGLYKTAFGTRFTLADGIATHIFDTSVISDYFGQQDDYITTALLKSSEYSNFEMQVNCSGKENNVGYYWPMLVFGVQNPTCWVGARQGGYATGVYNEGRTFLKGVVNEEYVVQSDPSIHKDAESGYFEAAWYPYTLKIRVTGHKATVTVIPLYEWGKKFSYSYDLGNGYKGGYVGFASTGQNCRFWNFKITDLGGETVSDVYSDLTNIEQASALFNVYKGENISSVAETDMSSAFYATQAGIAAADASVVTALYNGHKYRSFEMQVTCKNSGGADNVYPTILFGVNNPYNSLETGFGIAVYKNGKIGLCGRKTEISDGSGAIPASYSGELIIRVRIDGYKAAVTVIPENSGGACVKAQFYLGKNYRQGFVGFAVNGSGLSFSDFRVRDLGNKAYFDTLVGDLNYDGRVMADDLVLLRKGILMQRQGYLKPESDVNYDGKTDILDLIALKKYYSYRK